MSGVLGRRALAAALVTATFAAHAQTDFSNPYPYWTQQLPRQHELCINAFEQSGTLAALTRMVYTLVPEHASHRGQAVDVFIGHRSGAKLDRWRLLRPGATPTWVDWTPGQPPWAFTGDTPLLLADKNPLVLIDAPSAPLDWSTLIASGPLYIGYGLRDTVNGSFSRSFQEMLDHERFGAVFATYGQSLVKICHQYTTIRVRPKAAKKSGGN